MDLGDTGVEVFRWVWGVVTPKKFVCNLSVLHNIEALDLVCGTIFKLWADLGPDYMSWAGSVCLDDF